MDHKLRTGPLTTEEINHIRILAASDRVGHGDIQRLATELLRHYHTVYRSVREHRRRIADQNHEITVASLCTCDAMVHSGKSHAALMARLWAEPMPGPNHGQPQ